LTAGTRKKRRGRIARRAGTSMLEVCACVCPWPLHPQWRTPVPASHCPRLVYHVQPAAVAGLSAAAAVCLILALVFYFFGARWEARARAVGVFQVSPAANVRAGPNEVNLRADAGCSRCSRRERKGEPPHGRNVPVINLDPAPRDCRSMGGQERPREMGAKLDCVQVFSPPSRSYVCRSIWMYCARRILQTKSCRNTH